MIYGSICSGIEAATVAWHPLGWTPAFFSEIDAFPRAVLTHRFPHVPLHGDFTTIGTDDYGPIDLLVGGTPCQSFSCAGKRLGLDDPRGNLTLELLRLVERKRPAWVVWENVPGVISQDGGDVLRTVLDTFNDLGYAVELDILDAQHFGVPQRRRRIFVVCHHLAIGLKQKTPLSALTAMNCLIDILLGVLVAHYEQCNIGGKDWASRKMYSAGGARKRMKLLGLLSDERGDFLTALAAFRNLRQLLDGVLARFHLDPVNWGSASEPQRGRAADTAGERLLDGETASPSMSISPSWSESLAVAYERASASTTLTATRTITTSTIYSCAEAFLNIADSIVKLTDSFPSLWNEDSSLLIGLQAFTKYARQADSDIFERVGRGNDWYRLARTAQAYHDAVERRVGNDWRPPAAVLFEPESLHGDITPRREKKENVAAFTPGSIGGYREGVGTCRANGGDSGGGSETLIAHSLRAEGFDASEDGTGRGTPLVPIAASTLKSNNGGGGFGSDPSETFVPIALDATQITSKENRSRPEPGDPYHPLTPVAFTCKDFGADAADISPTLRAMGHGSSHPNGGGQVAVAIPIQEVSKRTGVSTTDPRAGIGIGASGDPMYTLQSGAQHAVAFDLRGRDGGAMPEGAHDTVNMRASSGGSSRSYLATAMAVRRITPREAERLQGFEDDWTLVPYRGKPAADGPRYRALGNAMAVPVMRWIGSQIAEVDRFLLSCQK